MLQKKEDWLMKVKEALYKIVLFNIWEGNEKNNTSFLFKNRICDIFRQIITKNNIITKLTSLSLFNILILRKTIN